KLIRVLSFEWLRRSKGLIDLEKQPAGMRFNKVFKRPRIYHQSLEEMREGRILKSTEINTGFEVDLENSSVDEIKRGVIAGNMLPVTEDTDEDEFDSFDVNALSGIGNIFEDEKEESNKIEEDETVEEQDYDEGKHPEGSSIEDNSSEVG